MESLELQVNTRDVKASGWCCSSKHESNQVRVTRGCCGPIGECWQCWQQFRWRILLLCMKRPCTCFMFWPALGRFTVSDTFWFLFIMLTQILYLRESFSADVDDASLWWNDFGIHCGEVANFDFFMVWLLAQRNTVLNLIFGVPMERSIKYHRWIARLAIFFSFLHFILIVQYWFSTDTFADSIEEEHNISGLIMLACCSLMGLTGLEYIRRHYWEIFLKLHWIFMCTFLWAAVKHDEHFKKTFFLFAVICWGIDLFWRAGLIFFWGKSGKVLNVESLSGDITKITWSKEDFIYDGGQYCFICIPAIDLTQWHPFSISSSPDDSNNSQENTFHIRAIGDFTKQLSLLSKQDNITDWSKLQIFFEGPYGKLEIPLEKYNKIVLISGGIGITPMQSIWGDLMSMINNGINTFKEIHFVWYLREAEMVNEFNRIHWNSVKRIGGIIPNNNEFVYEMKINGILLRTSYIFTSIKNSHDKYNELKNKYGKGFFNGRPHCQEFIKTTIDTNASDNDKIGVCGCGPAPLLEDMKNYCAVKGIDCHSEVFHF